MALRRYLLKLPPHCPCHGPWMPCPWLCPCHGLGHGGMDVHHVWSLQDLLKGQAIISNFTSFHTCWYFCIFRDPSYALTYSPKQSCRNLRQIYLKIRSTYSYLLCAAIQVWYGIIMLIQRFFDMSTLLNAIQYNYCLTAGVAFWRAVEISSVHTCMSFAWMT